MQRRSTQAGGSLLALAIIAGLAAGIGIGSPAIGILLGTAIGLTAAVAIWLLNRRG